MYNLYFNQEAILRTIKGTNKFGEHEYNESLIKCRFQYKSSLLKNPNGANTFAVAQIYTNQQCNIKDSILYNNEIFNVIGIDHQVDLNGKTAYYIYYLNK